jgi:hypothetical protein
VAIDSGGLVGKGFTVLVGCISVVTGDGEKGFCVMDGVNVGATEDVSVGVEVL